jgi:hypothetical protein
VFPVHYCNVLLSINDPLHGRSLPCNDESCVWKFLQQQQQEEDLQFVCLHACLSELPLCVHIILQYQY